MSRTVVLGEHLSKQYRLGQVGTGSFGQDFKRLLYRVSGRKDPFEEIVEENDRTKKSKSGIVWALNDVNFEIKQGEVVGIIGKNGAGKSTLLKILSRVTGPSSGTIKSKGRIASLLEVGTGFHPDLSGRDNIFLNGAILGMRKSEIKRKFDEIVAFSGVEKYIDTPVKRYSSGMYVRLAFAVAAHLESEIMIIDEVLAVGDAEFQRKCMGKMKDVSSQGRTILFVSHNMVAVQNLCERCLLMSKGRLSMDGRSSAVIAEYIAQDIYHGATQIHRAEGVVPAEWDRPWGKAGATIQKVQVLSDGGQPTDSVFFLDPLNLRIYFETPARLSNVKFQVRISTPDGMQITRSDSKNDGLTQSEFEEGQYCIDLSMGVQLMPGDYSFYVFIASLDNTIFYDAIPNFGRFTVNYNARIPEKSELSQKVNTLINQPASWKINKI